MDFAEAEKRFQELQARIQRGEPLSEEQYQEEMQKLMVQDDKGTFWSPEPGTGQWLYFNGTEWVPGTPPYAAAPPGAPAGPTAAEPAGMPRGAVPGPAGEPEGVPAYVREGEPVPTGSERMGGIAPRPVRGSTFPLGEENTPWLPFAIGAIVLLLCAAVLFFGVRNFAGFATAGAKPTATEVAVEQPTETEVATTDTPEAATATPAPTATIAVVTVKLNDRLRVRAGPGTTFGVLATLDAGTTLTPLGRNQDSSWLQVQIPGGSEMGWVSAQYVTVNGDVNTLPVVNPNASPTPKP